MDSQLHSPIIRCRRSAPCEVDGISVNSAGWETLVTCMHQNFHKSHSQGIQSTSQFTISLATWSVQAPPLCCYCYYGAAGELQVTTRSLPSVGPPINLHPSTRARSKHGLAARSRHLHHQSSDTKSVPSLHTRIHVMGAERHCTKRSQQRTSELSAFITAAEFAGMSGR